MMTKMGGLKSRWTVPLIGPHTKRPITKRPITKHPITKRPCH